MQFSSYSDDTVIIQFLHIKWVDMYILLVLSFYCDLQGTLSEIDYSGTWQIGDLTL